jgi:hypothetical protein
VGVNVEDDVNAVRGKMFEMSVVFGVWGRWAGLEGARASGEVRFGLAFCALMIPYCFL